MVFGSFYFARRKGVNSWQQRKIHWQIKHMNCIRAA
nr:MAG TPA: hypothetical protein [Caudoviricetes sp.]